MIQFTRWSLFGCDISCMCHASYMHTFFRCCNWFKQLFLYYSYLAYSSLANHFKQAIIQNIILLNSTQHLLFMDLSVLNSIHLLSPSFLSGFAILSISMFPCCSSISGKGIRCAQAFRCSLIVTKWLFHHKNISNYRLGNEPTHTHIHIHTAINCWPDST